MTIAPLNAARTPQRSVPVTNSGRTLHAAGVNRLRAELLACVGWITPNLDELAILIESEPVRRQDIPAAASKLQQVARQAGNPDLHVVVTGGHLDRPDDFLRTPDGEEAWLPGERVETSSTHGTGCAFSSALLCQLLRGAKPKQAVEAAKAYVTGALKAAYPLGRGKGPMHHLFGIVS